MSSISNFKFQISNFLLELFFPSFCLGCQSEGTYLCEDCQATLEISQHCYCLCSKNPLSFSPENTGGTCNRCSGKNLSGLYAALPYQERSLTKALIRQFKYEPYAKALAKPLAGVLAEHFAHIGIGEETFSNAVLVPVPAERGKLKERGYNQTEELAKELAKKLNIPCIASDLIKIRRTKPQVTLSAKERQENLVDAFSIKNLAEFVGKKIFLVDDVYTTGATMEECAKTLKAAGAGSVWGIAIAREG